MDRFTQDIANQFYLKPLEKQSEKIESIFLDMINSDLRTNIILGTAYLEELLMFCVSATMTEDGWKTFLKKQKANLTYSLNLHLLYGQNHISKDFFQALDSIYKIRNLYAHNAFLMDKQEQSITATITNLKELVEDRFFDFYEESKIPKTGDDKFLYRLMSSLALTLNMLGLAIVPGRREVWASLNPNGNSEKMGLVVPDDENVTDELINLYKFKFEHDSRFKIIEDDEPRTVTEKI